MKAASWLGMGLLLMSLGSPINANAHFGILIPSKPTVMQKNDAKLDLTIAFAHPFSQEGMDMQMPEKFFVMANGERQDLTSTLRPAEFLSRQAFTAAYDVAKPGVYRFAVEPRPYFENAEDCFIIHYAKVIVGAYGEEDGFEKPLGLPVEIIPLSRPFANYSGNVFTGLVLRDGSPLANATVEVENLNAEKAHAAPNEYFETQIVKTDANGIFNFGIPWAGWWGFAALTSSGKQMEKDGQLKDVELGGVIWVNFASPKTR